MRTIKHERAYPVIEDVSKLALFFECQIEESILDEAPLAYRIWALCSLMSRWTESNDFYIASLWRLIVLMARSIDLPVYQFEPLKNVDEFIETKSTEMFGELKTAGELLTKRIDHYYPAIYNLHISILGCPTETEPAPPEFVAEMLLDLHKYLFAATTVAYANKTNLVEEMKFAIVNTRKFEYSSGIII